MFEPQSVSSMVESNVVKRVSSATTLGQKRRGGCSWAEELPAIVGMQLFMWMLSYVVFPSIVFQVMLFFFLFLLSIFSFFR